MARWRCRRPIPTEHPGLRLGLAAAIQSLPEKYREAIILRDFEGFPMGEIADQSLLTREAANNRIYRDRQLVRAYLKDGCRRWMHRRVSGSAVCVTSCRAFVSRTADPGHPRCCVENTR